MFPLIFPAYDAQKTTQPSEDVKLLGQQMVGQHGAHDDGQGAEGRDEDGGGEGVGGEVGNLAL